MTSIRTRDRYRVAVAAVTGISAAATVTASGWVAGTLTSATDAGGTPSAAPAPNDAAGVPSQHRQRVRPKVTLRHRKVVTRVRTVYVDQYVPVAPAPAAAAPAPVSHPAPAHHATPASHPAPAPQPTTTSGS
jgi:hypothetical protein